MQKIKKGKRITRKEEEMLLEEYWCKTYKKFSDRFNAWQDICLRMIKN